MPNWTENSMLIRKKDWAKFKEVAWNDEDNELTFDKLLPHPLEVRIDAYYNNIFTNHREDKDEDIPFDSEWFNDHKGEVSILRKVIKDLGLNTEGWCDWNCANWGTKWDACDSYIDNDDEIDDMDDDDQIHVMFNTAWSDPEPWYRALAAVIPFESECTEEGGFFHIIVTGDGEGNLDIEDDTQEYFQQQEEEEE